jgi:hypothetical protein
MERSTHTATKRTLLVKGNSIEIQNLTYDFLLFSVTPTIGGRNAGWRAELMHLPQEKIGLACGFASTIQPTVFASLMVSLSYEKATALTVLVVLPLMVWPSFTMFMILLRVP